MLLIFNIVITIIIVIITIIIITSGMTRGVGCLALHNNCNLIELGSTLGILYIAYYGCKHLTLEDISLKSYTKA